MMERNRFLGVIAVGLLLGAGACGDQNAAGNADIGESGATAAPAAPAAVPNTAAAPTSAPAEGGATLTVAHSPQYGSYLADGHGRALYLFTSDEPGKSTCSSVCADSWPPYTAPQSTPTAAAPEVQATLLSTLQRADGQTQVVYNQHPLYYYVQDKGLGKTTGQDVHEFGGEWYLLTPQGEKLEK